MRHPWLLAWRGAVSEKTYTCKQWPPPSWSRSASADDMDKTLSVEAKISPITRLLPVDLKYLVFCIKVFILTFLFGMFNAITNLELELVI